MKITIRELMGKIDGINKVIDDLETNNPPSGSTIKQAVEYLDEYVDMLKDTKVDI